VCKTTDKGYVLTSGRIIPFHGVDLLSLTPEEFKELAETKSTLLGELRLRDQLHKLTGSVNNMNGRLDVVIEHQQKFFDELEKKGKAIDAHTTECLNKDAVVDIVRTEIDKTPSRKLTSISDKAQKVYHLLVLVVVVVQLLILFNVVDIKDEVITKQQMELTK